MARKLIQRLLGAFTVLPVEHASVKQDGLNQLVSFGDVSWCFRNDMPLYVSKDVNVGQKQWRLSQKGSTRHGHWHQVEMVFHHSDYSNMLWLTPPSGKVDDASNRFLVDIGTFHTLSNELGNNNPRIHHEQFNEGKSK